MSTAVSVMEGIMKLYYSPGACSLAAHVTLIEAGAKFDLERVDLGTKKAAGGADFLGVNPRGAVPVLVLDDGAILTECAAITQHVADNAPGSDMPAQGSLARARLYEAFNYLSSELHKTYSPFFRPMSDEARKAQTDLLNARLAVIESRLGDGRAWIAGDRYTPADAYFFVLTSWSKEIGHDLSAFPRINALRAKIAERPAVKAAMKAEGLA